MQQQQQQQQQQQRHTSGRSNVFGVYNSYRIMRHKARPRLTPKQKLKLKQPQQEEEEQQQQQQHLPSACASPRLQLRILHIFMGYLGERAHRVDAASGVRVRGGMQQANWTGHSKSCL
ncbi:putative uncharacterized protein DDB_G0274435 [Drosophila montana]|uniref:putative uncharacterized protein DDB_G0274435 n=1 Tax=Drosophila montana TaxID=40370 RepID=UPI00313D5CFA